MLASTALLANSAQKMQSKRREGRKRKGHSRDGLDNRCRQSSVVVVVVEELKMSLSFFRPNELRGYVLDSVLSHQVCIRQGRLSRSKIKQWSVKLVLFCSNNGGLLQVTSFLFLSAKSGAARNWWVRHCKTLRSPEALDLAEVLSVLLGGSVWKGRHVMEKLHGDSVERLDLILKSKALLVLDAYQTAAFHKVVKSRLFGVSPLASCKYPPLWDPGGLAFSCLKVMMAQQTGGSAITVTRQRT
ncbi:hypothetical protein BJ508DRAFT_311721 [Ascobolus immersus RN42]|uniref:Uncharacterized protein n=1 Tax=Ascobolus immersus RN42 TaxID=1160509 RepID=A0A3N4HQY1_ASCIM|nr:hypothetical protein BJ508DRAFT_311721 [Ascobolus immersus RN42]